jgi:hypothetical protein
MEHAIAWKHRHRLYRNYYVAGPDQEDWQLLQSLCERGLMEVIRQPSDMFGDMTVFAVTIAGQEALSREDKVCSGVVVENS